MPKTPDASFITIGSTPSRVKKLSQDAVALSPTEPLVIDTVDQHGSLIVRITNYQIGTVVGQIPFPKYPHTLSFSPDGKHLLAMPGGKGSGRSGRLLVYSEPWEDRPAVIFDDDHTLETTFHGAWLDEREIMVAGTLQDNEMCIAIIDVKEKALRVVHRERLYLLWRALVERHVSPLDASCSSSGLVAVLVPGPPRVFLYQLSRNRDEVSVESDDFLHDSDVDGIFIAEDGQTLFCTDRYSTTLFNRDGQQLAKLTPSEPEKVACNIVYKHGCVYLRSKTYDYETAGAQIYRVTNGELEFWCSRIISTGDSAMFGNWARGCDLTIRDGKTLIVIEEKDQTTVFELVDLDILRLASDDAEQRRQAALELGRRRYRPAVPELTHLLRDDSPSVQRAAFEALTEIADPEALPVLIRAIGHEPRDNLNDDWVSALRRFPSKELIPAIFDCLARPRVVYRRGATRVLECMPSINALEALCEAIHDVDTETRLSAAHALRKRADLRASVALLGHLNDEDERVRLAVQRAVTRILEATGLLSNGMSQRLSTPLDAAGYAQDLILAGRMHRFEDFGDPSVGQFLTGLAAACVESEQPLPQILNAIEDLTRTPEPCPVPSPACIGLTLAVMCADAMMVKERWREAAGIYRYVLTLARHMDAPQIEWRAWYAVGECREALAEDPAALIAFRNAMGIIDRLWFALLEEDEPLRNFFQDKALLYDRAGLCCLRLGHRAQALECNEKAKTRYLGDLIARRQMDPQVVLDAELREFWKQADQLRSIRVGVSSQPPADREKLKIVAVEWGKVEAAIQPERLAAFEEACPDGEECQDQHTRLREIWRLVSFISTHGDESIRERLEAMYRALQPIYEAVETGSLPTAESDQEESVEQFDSAAQALWEKSDVNRDVPFWTFAEYDRQWHIWIRRICSSTEPDETDLFLGAVMEALNSVLHHEDVLAIRVDKPVDEDQEGPVFVTRSLSGESASSSRTTRIETALERYSQTRWRYITRLARGEISTYRDVIDSLSDQAQVAQVQFLVSEHGTAAYVTLGYEVGEQQLGKMPNLQGEGGMQVFTCQEVTLSSLRQRLMQAKDSWFALYRQDLREEWKEAMDRTLKWLNKHLMAPIDAHLQESGIKRLRIIPHRGLHLIPFAALYTQDNNGQRHYLIDRYDIEYAPSVTLQQICRERSKGRAPRRSLSAISNPTNDLPFSAIEVEHVCGYFRDSEVQLWAGKKALLEAVTACAPGSIFHFAGHGEYKWDDPLASHLCFARKEPLRLDDLFAEKILLPETSLVVLSACETNVTDPEDRADEYLGLASGFLFAGTPAVISSLWSVESASTALLMGRFYRLYLADKLDPATALRCAQRWLRDSAAEELSLVDIYDRVYQESGKTDSKAFQSKGHYKAHPDEKPFEHPYYWAAFVLSGVGV